MAGDEGAVSSRPLEYTPTWTVAIICTIYVAISLLAERGLHRLGKWLTRTKRKPLYEALEKIKEELMLLGFISLLLTVTADYVPKICVKTSIYEKQPSPCKKPSKTADNGRIVFKKFGMDSFRRNLAFTRGQQCPKGKEAFISFLSLEQLHRFIFVLAVTHIFYSCITMVLALIKVHRWRPWEQEAQSSTHDTLAADISRSLTRQRNSTFVMYHTSRPWSKNRFFVWLVCFFRQFGQSVTRVDYLALRMGFIKNHHMSESYDFHSYMIRSMEDEFKKVVGISIFLWTFVVGFMLFNIEGLNLYVWFASIPIVLIFLVGTKLQHVIATLALENAGIDGHHGSQQIRPRDELFWFNRPKLMLKLLHFILFENSFELATFFWSWWQFGYNSCLLRNHYLVYARLISGLLVQCLFSYSTLPLHAIVTQMGTNYKRAIFTESVVESLHGWHRKAHRKAKLDVVFEGSSAEAHFEGEQNAYADGNASEDADDFDESEVELEDVQGSNDYKQQSMPILRTANSSVTNVIVGHKFRSMHK